MSDRDLQSQLLLAFKSPATFLTEYLTNRLNRLQPSPEALVLVVALVIGRTIVLIRSSYFDLKGCRLLFRD